MKTAREKYSNYLNAFKDQITDMVTEGFIRDNGVHPILFALVIKDGKLGITILAGMAELFRSDEGKEMAAKLMRQMAEHVKPVALAFVSEAWMVDYNLKNGEKPDILDEDGNYKEGIARPKEHPNKKEILMINFETHDRFAFHYMNIIRGKDRPELTDYMLEDWTPKEKVEITGKFMNLLEDNWSELEEILRNQQDFTVN
jgi:hypothetical protein